MPRIIITSILTIFLLGFASQKQQEIVEEVEVVNILIPVRVFHKGNPVDNLKKEDFEIFENGRLQHITDFEIIRKKINIDKEKLYSKETKGRFFIITFNVFEFNKEVEKGIDTFFKKIYHQKDKVIIVTPERTFNITSSKEMIKSMPVLKNILKIYSRKAKTELNNVFRKLETAVNQFFETHFKDIATTTFINTYRRIWKNYSQKYLIPDINKFYKFADFLKNIKMEKWVIVFQQKTVFPQFKAFSRIEEEIRQWLTVYYDKPTTPVLEQMLQRLRSEFKISTTFPLKEIREAFFKANATFHVLLFRTYKNTISQDFHYSEAVSDYENSFKSISKVTGGDIVSTNKLNEALEKVSEKKDVHYILSYAPRETHNEDRKIKIKLPNHKTGYNLFYLKNLKLHPELEIGEEKSQIEIENYSFKNNQMNFSLINYLRKQPAKDRKKIGIIDVNIIVVNTVSENIVYQKSNILKASQPKTNIGIKFDFLKKGNYHLIIDLFDKLTNKSKIVTKLITI